MKPMINPTRSVLVALVAGTALVMSSAAFAQVYVQQQPPQPRYEDPGAARTHGAEITLGWQGDRYWDGHRYWEHDEWMHRHPHERDPQRDREQEHHEY